MSAIASQLTMKYGFPITHEDKETEKAVTVRPSSTAIFAVDSSDRYLSYVEASTGTQSPYKFSITRNQALLNGFFTRIALTEIVFPYYIYNLNARTAYIRVSLNGGAFQVIDLTTYEGMLSPTEFATFFEGVLQIQLAIPGLTVVYSDGRFFINTNTPDTIAFARGNFTGLNTQASTLQQFQMFDLLNMTVSNTVQSSVQVTGVTRLRYTEYVDIVCSQLTYNQELKDGSSDPVNRDILARIYIENEDGAIQPYFQPKGFTVGPPGTITGTEVTSEVSIPGTYPFTINRKFPMPKQILWNKAQPLGNLTFEVYDDKGELLSNHVSAYSGFPAQDYMLPNWRMTLLVSEN